MYFPFTRCDLTVKVKLKIAIVRTHFIGIIYTKNTLSDNNSFAVYKVKCTEPSPRIAEVLGAYAKAKNKSDSVRR
ncbi:MAG: hypothetical protein K0S32_2362 [Bacteroidetes bacterium]|jgi:hypothetical protein|nr:hypothetical protein [Bacteroidota bacterium]